MWRLVCSDPPVTVQVGADAPRSLGRSSLGAHVSREQPYQFVSRTQASLSVDDAETLSVTAVGSNPTQVRRANGVLSVLPNGTAMQLDAGDHIVLDRQKRDGSVIFVVHGPAAAALPAAPLLELLSVRDADSLVGSDVTSGVKLVLLVEHAADAAHDVAYVWFAWDTLIKYERAAGTEPLRQLAARLTPGGRFYEAAAKTEWVDKQRVDEGLKPWQNVCEWKCNPPHTWRSFSQDAQRLASAAACGPRELRGALEALAPPSSDHLPPAREGSGGKRRRNEPPSAPGPSADDDGGRALCPPWELPLGESRWYLTARHLHGGTVSYGGRNITPNEHSKPCSLAAFTPEYVPADLASTLTRLLDGVDVVPFDDSARFDDSVQAPATVPNAFGGMRPPSSPSRMAFAEAEGLTYRYGRVRYVTKPTLWSEGVAGRPEEEARLGWSPRPCPTREDHCPLASPSGAALPAAAQARGAALGAGAEGETAQVQLRPRAEARSPTRTGHCTCHAAGLLLKDVETEGQLGPCYRVEGVHLTLPLP